MKLSLDEKELLEELVERQDLMQVLFKLANHSLSLIEESVLKYKLEESDSHIPLLINKARAEGAAQLVAALRMRLQPKKRS